MRAFVNPSRFRGNSGLATWLTRIALNEALGDLAADDPRVVAFPSPPAPTAEAEAGRSQVRMLLEPLIDDLPPDFRVVLILRDVEGMTTEEAADHLGIRPETARTRLHRARRLLRAAVLERRETPGP